MAPENQPLQSASLVKPFQLVARLPALEPSGISPRIHEPAIKMNPLLIEFYLPAA
jgi:hypothetical protein